MLLVERHRELQVLADSCASAARGDGRLLVLTGAGGTGKTALLRAFADRTTRSGATVRTAVGAEAERDHPFGVLAQLLRHPHDSHEVELLDHVGTSPPDVVIRRIGGALAESARRELLVLAIDDAHHADTESLAVLSYLLRRLPMLPLLMILTEATTPSVRPAFRAGLPRHQTTRVLRLAPLSEAGVARVLADVLDDPTAARLAPSCYDLTGGNPLLVRAAVEEFARSGALSKPGPSWATTGDGFGRAVLACLPPGLPDIACALAVLGDLADADRVARLTNTLPFEVDKVVRVLTAAGLLVEGHFRHAALGVALLDHLSAPERSRLHADAAWLLYEEGAEPGQVAAHLAEAGPLTEPWAVALLRDAATEALCADDLDLARERLRVAQRCCTSASDRAAVVLSRVSLDSRVDPAIARRLLGPLVEAARAGELTGGDVLDLVHHLVWHGRLTEASACLSTLDTADPCVTAPLHAARAWLGHTCPPLLTDALRAEENTAPLILVGRNGRAAEALRAVLAEGTPEHAVVAAEELLAGLTFDEDGVTAAESALLALVYAGRVDAALPYCESWLAEATERDVPTWVAVLACTRAVIAQHVGDPLAAEKYARMALNSISAEGWGVAVAAPLAVLVWAATETGRAKDAAAWLNHPVPSAAFQTRYGPLYLHARGEYHLAAGRPATAMKDFVNCGDMLRWWGIDLPSYAPWRSSAALAHLALGAPDKAKELIRAQASSPGAAVFRTKAITLRVTAATKMPKERPAPLQEALTLLARTGDRSETVRVLAELAQIFRDLGLTGRARVTARRAWSLARECGLESLCDRQWTADLKAHLHVVEDDETLAEDAVPLTESERAVARLAALEHTNREISRKMHITVSTVEQHLTRVYRKLGVNGRRQIALVLRMNTADSA